MAIYTWLERDPISVMERRLELRATYGHFINNFSKIVYHMQEFILQLKYTYKVGHSMS